MHVRASLVRGIPVVDDTTQEVAGYLLGPLIDPDSGKILGFFVSPVQSAFSELFLMPVDIIGWGTKVHVRSADRLSPPGDLIRLQDAFADPRTFLGQTIRSEKLRRSLGRCVDVQFNTRHLHIEWLFPRKFLFVRQPIPASDVMEVTEAAIIVREPMRADPIVKSSLEREPGALTPAGEISPVA